MKRIDSQDADGLEDAPWYVSFLVRVGVPTAFASLLLWFLVSNVTTTLAKIEARQAIITDGQGTIVGNQARIIQMLQDNARAQVGVTRFLSAMCYNAATSGDERDRCTMAGGTDELK